MPANQRGTERRGPAQTGGAGVLDQAATIAMELIGENPRPITEAAVRGVLENAWEGRRPA